MKINEVIKLGNNSYTSVKPFMWDFVDATEESPIGKGRLYDDVLIDVHPFDGGIRISDIVAVGDKAKGKGTAALKFLTNLADRHGVKLSGHAKAYSQSPEHIQTSERLLQWYQKHGFQERPDRFGSEDEGFDIKYDPAQRGSNQ